MSIEDDRTARLLDALYADDLPTEEAARIRAAIEADPEARAQLAAWSAVRTAAARLPEREPDPQVRYEILRAARQAPHLQKKAGFFEKLWQWSLNPVVAGVGLLVVAGSLFVVYSGREDAPSDRFAQPAAVALAQKSGEIGPAPGAAARTGTTDTAGAADQAAAAPTTKVEAPIEDAERPEAEGSRGDADGVLRGGNAAPGAAKEGGTDAQKTAELPLRAGAKAEPAREEEKATEAVVGDRNSAPPPPAIVPPTAAPSVLADPKADKELRRTGAELGALDAAAADPAPVANEPPAEKPDPFVAAAAPEPAREDEAPRAQRGELARQAADDDVELDNGAVAGAAPRVADKRAAPARTESAKVNRSKATRAPRTRSGGGAAPAKKKSGKGGLGDVFDDAANTVKAPNAPNEPAPFPAAAEPAREPSAAPAPPQAPPPAPTAAPAGAQAPPPPAASTGGDATLAKDAPAAGGPATPDIAATPTAPQTERGPAQGDVQQRTAVDAMISAGTAAAAPSRPVEAPMPEAVAEEQVDGRGRALDAETERTAAGEDVAEADSMPADDAPARPAPASRRATTAAATGKTAPAAEPPPRAAAAESLASARALRDGGRLAEATRAYEAVMAAGGPQADRAAFEAAAVHERLGNLDRALKLYARVANNNGPDADAARARLTALSAPRK